MFWGIDRGMSFLGFLRGLVLLLFGITVMQFSAGQCEKMLKAVPVSYTHLDVYKRQLQGRWRIHLPYLPGGRRLTVLQSHLCKSRSQWLNQCPAPECLSLIHI